MLRTWTWFAVPVALLMLIGGRGAHAQTGPQSAAPSGVSEPTTSSSSPSEGVGLEEIVVTARKRSETVQSVPATVSVVDETALANAAVTSFEDISKVVPAINIAPSPSANQFAATVRGLGTEPGNPSFDSSVATYVDGAFLSRDREFAASLFDMSSLETISGTQAALLGKNSSLGALNLVTTKPGDSYAVDIRYHHEFELDSDRVEAGVDLPVLSSLKFRLAGLYDSEGGPVEDVVSGAEYRDRRAGGRLTAVWTPSDKIDVTALFQSTNDVIRGPTATVVLYGDAPNILASYFGYPNKITTPFGKNAQYSPALGYDQYETLNMQLGMVTANFHVGKGAITSQTGYSTSRSAFGGNYTYLPGNGLLTTQPPDRSKQFTQELRYSSSIGSRFDYIAGVFYLYNQFGSLSTEATDLPFGTTPLPFPITGAATTYFQQTDHAASVFGQGNYRISDPFELALGLRYTNEDKDADFARTATVPGIYSLVLAPPVAPFPTTYRTMALPLRCP